MEFQLYKIKQGDCPYIEEKTWETLTFSSSSFEDFQYEKLINQGMRRSGQSIYQNICENCNSCISIRVNVKTFSPNKSQKRTSKKNGKTRYTVHELRYYTRDFELYKKYINQWHSEESSTTNESYKQFLISSPVSSKMMRYKIGRRLVGISYIDVLPNSLSSVYFSFDPDYRSYSLGTFSILQEIEYAKSLGKKWLHLGFWVENCSKMDYKNKFYPHEKLIDLKWVEFKK